MIRTALTIALIAGLSSTAAFSQAAKPAAAAASTTKAAYTVADTTIGTLLDDPAAKAVLDKHIPGMTSNDQIEMARAMTLKDIQQYAADTITDKVLAAVEADLSKIAPKK